MQILSDYELYKGLIVTIHHWKHDQDHSWCGDRLEITRVGHPYVQVTLPDGDLYTLDLRECVFMKYPTGFFDTYRLNHLRHT